MSSDRQAVLAAYDDLDAAFDKVLGWSVDVLTDSEKLNLESRMERNLRRAPAVEQSIVFGLLKSVAAPIPAQAWQRAPG